VPLREHSTVLEETEFVLVIYGEQTAADS